MTDDALFAGPEAYDLALLGGVVGVSKHGDHDQQSHAGGAGRRELPDTPPKKDLAKPKKGKWPKELRDDLLDRSREEATATSLYGEPRVAQHINESLRGDRSGLDEEFSDDLNSTIGWRPPADRMGRGDNPTYGDIAEMTEEAARPLPVAVQAWRGDRTSEPPPGKGERFVNKGFTSVAGKKSAAQDFAGIGFNRVSVTPGTGDHQVFSRVEIPESARAAWGHPALNELILPPGAEFEVTQSRVDEDGVTHQTLQLVSERDVSSGKSRSLKHGDHDQSTHGRGGGGVGRVPRHAPVSMADGGMQQFTVKVGVYSPAAQEELVWYKADSDDVNHALRAAQQDGGGLSAHEEEQTEERARLIDEAFEVTEPLGKDVTTYRGMESPALAGMVRDGGGADLVGTTIRDPAFVSTSADTGTALGFVEGSNDAVMLEVRLGPDDKALPMDELTGGPTESGVPEEFELLLERDQEMEIVGVETHVNEVGGEIPRVIVTPQRGAGKAARPSAAARGYGHAWRKRRREFLARNQDCADCGKQATVADHTPTRAVLLEQGVEDPDADEYLVARCQSCHSSKTCSYDGGFGNPVAEKHADHDQSTHGSGTGGAPRRSLIGRDDHERLAEKVPRVWGKRREILTQHKANSSRTNKLLRDGADLDLIDRGTVKTLDRTFDKTKPLGEPVTTFRGAEDSTLAGMALENPEALVGSTIRDDAFLSTSSDEGFAADVARDAGLDAGVLMEIRLGPEDKAIPMDVLVGDEAGYTEEDELLLERGVDMEVIGVSSEGDVPTVVVTPKRGN